MMWNRRASWKGAWTAAAALLIMGSAGCGGEAQRRPEIRSVESADTAPRTDRTQTDDPTRPPQGQPIDIVEGGSDSGPVVIEEGAPEVEAPIDPVGDVDVEEEPGAAEIDLNKAPAPPAMTTKRPKGTKKKKDAVEVGDVEVGDVEIEPTPEGPTDLELSDD